MQLRPDKTIPIGVEDARLLQQIISDLQSRVETLERQQYRYLSLKQIAAPGAAGASNARIYARDNGSGKTQIVAIFNTGAVQVIATQP